MKRSRIKAKARPKKSAADTEHLTRVASLGCIVCSREGFGFTEPEIHHIRHGRGIAQRAPDSEAIPLCYHHHRGKYGIHTLGTRRWERLYGLEIDLLGVVREILGINTI